MSTLALAPKTLAPEIEFDEAPPPSRTQAAAPRRALSPRAKFLLLGIPLLAAAAFALSSWLAYAAKFEETDDAFIEADVHPVSSRITGDILEVLVEDNQIVTKGQPLAKLDPRDYEMKLAFAKTALEQAAAQIPQAEAALARAQAAGREATAKVAVTVAQLEKARLDFDRAEKLFTNESRAISRQDLDSAKSAFDSATANQTAAVASQEASGAGVRAAEADLAAAKAGRDHAQAVLDDAALQLSYTILRAPDAGRVGKRTLQTGQHVQPGQALLAIVSPDNWIVANFKENQLSHMRPGQSVEIEIDAIHGRRFSGHVDSFSPGTGAKFTLLPPDNATGNFTKIVQRLPVKILLDEAEAKAFAARLSPGLSVIATVRVAP
ncbi:HlyD family secretion protein [Prosthecobacter sp.]|uniref:HlyD family secretion protein n=1 Tax=Prosthecobacter sp. TaxID=1965333 RepID=UPI003782EFAB